MLLQYMAQWEGMKLVLKDIVTELNDDPKGNNHYIDIYTDQSLHSGIPVDICNDSVIADIVKPIYNEYKSFLINEPWTKPILDLSIPLLYTTNIAYFQLSDITVEKCMGLAISRKGILLGLQPVWLNDNVQGFTMNKKSWGTFIGDLVPFTLKLCIDSDTYVPAP